MSDFQGSSFTAAPPPPPSAPPSTTPKLPMLIYGLVVVGITAIALALYNIIILKRHRDRRHMQSQQPNGSAEVVITTSSSIGNSERNSLTSFKYKKERGKEVGGDDYECPICLSVYEEGEEVRKLPRCEHSYHASCIDMWLYSHFDCPVCRTPVRSFCHPTLPENSRPTGLMLEESGGAVSV